MTDITPFHDPADTVFAERVRKALVPLCQGKPQRFHTRTAERFWLHINMLPIEQRRVVRAATVPELREDVLPRMLSSHGEVFNRNAQENYQPVSYVPGGTSNFIGTVARFEEAYTDVFAVDKPRSRQRVWAGQDPEKIEPDEVLVKASNRRALYDWAVFEGFGDWVDGEWQWFIPADEGIPIVVDNTDPENPVLSTEFHANLRVL